jgi:hypothetical protein
MDPTLPRIAARSFLGSLLEELVSEHQLSSGGEFSAIVGIENSLAGDRARTAGMTEPNWNRDKLSSRPYRNHQGRDRGCATVIAVLIGWCAGRNEPAAGRYGLCRIAPGLPPMPTTPGAEWSETFDFPGDPGR